MPLSLIPFVFLAVPIAEIATFILVGREIGVLPTLAMIFVTAILGTILLRVQGFGLLARIRQETDQGRVPGRELVHGVMILVAGVLLLTPGFITDTLGFLLFVPPLRDAGWRLLKSRISVVPVGGGFSARSRRPDGAARPGSTPDGKPVINLDADEFERSPEKDSDSPNDEGSPFGDGNKT